MKAEGKSDSTTERLPKIRNNKIIKKLPSSSHTIAKTKPNNFYLCVWASRNMMNKNAAIRRILASRLSHVKTVRSYHAGSKLLADALDMVDTFDRRHSEFQYNKAFSGIFTNADGRTLRKREFPP